MCRLVRALIEGLPVTVSECRDGAQVLSACGEVQPDWVVIDLTLAGTDALALTRQITALHGGARVLLLSQEDDPRLRDAAARAGAWAVVHKESLVDLRQFLALAVQPSQKGSLFK